MVTLNTAPGDGGLSVGVDPLGAFGSDGTIVIDRSDAFYDPLGATGAGGTVFESSLAIGVNNDDDPSRIFLSEENFEPPAFSNVTETTATSEFNLFGLDFVLEQEVSDFTEGNQRIGSDLTQDYTITNTTEAPIEFELVRYLDGDLQFDESISDTGGRYLNSLGGTVLFETDSGDSGTDATTFVGIDSLVDGQGIPSDYEISQFSDLRSNILAGESLSNVTQGDGEDEDQFIDGEPYDVTLGLGNTLVLEPGQSLTYSTATFFGSGVPEDLVTGGGDIAGTGTGIPVYRFFRNDTQTEFYTTSEAERDAVLNTLPQYQLEGVAFVGAPNVDPLTGTSPVYRFFNNDTGIHLYTVDENERAFVENNLDNYTLESTPYYGYDTQVEGSVPLYRFYNQGLDAHFYTPFAEERDFYIQSPNYEPEGGGDGIAFYVEPVSEF